MRGTRIETGVEAEIEAEILERRLLEERADSNEMWVNAIALVVLLVVFVLIWRNWGESGFKRMYRQVDSYAVEQAASAQKKSISTRDSKSTIVTSALSMQTNLPVMPATPSASEITAAIGQSGDAYGGANALFSALVASFAAWAGYLQFRALKRSQRAYQDQLDENRREKFVRKNEEADRQVARFEAQFFQLLDLANDARELITATKTSPNRDPKVGSAALDAFANTIYKEAVDAASAQPPIPVSARELTYHYQKIYARRPSALGPYFRLLFQTFKFISSSNVNPTVKLQCARISRGQMSDGSVFLLALNGMSFEGHDFVEYIEEFGLLEHMLDKHRTTFGPYLEEAYRPRAFLGSNERAKTENTHNPSISFSADRFHWTSQEMTIRDGMKSHQYIGVGNDVQD